MAFLCLGFVLRIFQTPELALLPAIVVLTIFSARIRLPFRIPGGLVCIVTGAILAAILKWAHLYHLPVVQTLRCRREFICRVRSICLHFCGTSEGWKFLSIILPMSALDTIVSLQVLESVQVAGDDYPTMPSLLVNGLATLAASLFGSPFPTSLYFGHMAHKALGARSGYSILSGTATMLLCLSGMVVPFLRVVPMEVVAMIVVWFGLVMVAQAFTEVPKSHAIAVAFGLIPILASWAVGLIDLALRKGRIELSARARRCLATNCRSTG